MISPRITEVVTSLTKDELERLGDFLRSPYHNSGYNSERITSLFEIIRVAFEEGQMDRLEKQGLNEHFFPDRPFVAKKKNPIDALSSDLFAKIKQFLFFEYVQRPALQMHQSLALAQFYRLNNYEERFWQVIRQFRKQHANQGYRNANHYLDAFMIEAEVAAFRSVFNTYTDDANITTAEHYLDQFYATQQIENIVILTYQQKLGANGLDTSKLTAPPLLAGAYADYPSFHTPLAGHYATILDWLNRAPEAGELEEFIANLKAQESAIEPSKFRNLMAFYRYFLTLQYRQEATGIELLERLFTVFKAHLEHGYFLVHDKLMPISLKALVSLATKLGKISWIKQVLIDYPPERITGTRYPTEAHSLCEAEVLFANQEYGAAQDRLIYCNFENVNYSILADVLLIKIYYVLDDDLLENRIQALEKKVRRTKLSQRDKSGYVNFLRFLFRVLKYQHDRQSKKWQKLEQDLHEIRPMLEREWLSSIMLQPVQ